MTQSQFNSIDTNGDGSLSERELDKASSPNMSCSGPQEKLQFGLTSDLMLVLITMLMLWGFSTVPRRKGLK